MFFVWSVRRHAEEPLDKKLYVESQWIVVVYEYNYIRAIGDQNKQSIITEICHNENPKCDVLSYLTLLRPVEPTPLPKNEQKVSKSNNVMKKTVVADRIIVYIFF